MSGNRRKVHDDDHEVRRIVGTAHERDDAPFEVAAVHPFESGVIEVHLMQRALFLEGAIEIPHPMLNALMVLVLEQVPVQTLVVIPFAPLPKLTSHEHELLARMAKHVSVERSQRGALLPDVSWHFVEHRALAVDDLVM